MLPAAMDRVLLHVLEHVVHPAHVPLVGEAEAAECTGRLTPGHDVDSSAAVIVPGMLAVRQAVQLLQKR